MRTHHPTPADSPIRVYSTTVPDAITILPAVAVFNRTDEHGYWIVQSERDGRWWSCLSDSITVWSRLIEEAPDA